LFRPFTLSIQGRYLEIKSFITSSSLQLQMKIKIAPLTEEVNKDDVEW